MIDALLSASNALLEFAGAMVFIGICAYVAVSIARRMK